MLYFISFIAFVVFQRLLELVVARQNEQWARSQGALEYGQSHYPYIVLLHTMFIISMIVEYLYKGGAFNYVVLLIFFVLIMLKVWIISSLGKYWNTKILKVPGSAFVRKGLYKFFKHPNYFIVVCEIIVIPLVFNLYITVVVFTVLNSIMLRVRIKEEERVWGF